VQVRVRACYNIIVQRYHVSFCWCWTDHILFCFQLCWKTQTAVRQWLTDFWLSLYSAWWNPGGSGWFVLRDWSHLIVAHASVCVCELRFVFAEETFRKSCTCRLNCIISCKKKYNAIKITEILWTKLITVAIHYLVYLFLVGWFLS